MYLRFSKHMHQKTQICCNWDLCTDREQSKAVQWAQLWSCYSNHNSVFSLPCFPPLPMVTSVPPSPRSLPSITQSCAYPSPINQSSAFTTSLNSGFLPLQSQQYSPSSGSHSTAKSGSMYSIAFTILLVVTEVPLPSSNSHSNTFEIPPLSLVIALLPAVVTFLFPLQSHHYHHILTSYNVPFTGKQLPWWDH